MIYQDRTRGAHRLRSALVVLTLPPVSDNFNYYSGCAIHDSFSDMAREGHDGPGRIYSRRGGKQARIRGVNVRCSKYKS